MTEFNPEDSKTLRFVRGEVPERKTFANDNMLV
jgi:hypothetical protein